MELGLEQAIVAHKAFLLALIQSGKITAENMLKVLHEFKQSALDFDHECIYCKYSQYALRESTKVIKNSLKQSMQGDSMIPSTNPTSDGSESAKNTDGGSSPGKEGASTPGQDPRIEYLIRMF
jgi:hypothetical protein